MGRSIEEIRADIARVKAEMALRNKYEQGFNQPQTRTGWSSYIVTGDRGLLDAYQNRENQWKNQMQQQGYQAAQSALNRKFQEEQNDLNRDLQLEIAKMNKANAAEDKTDAARLKYQQLLIEREEIKRKGGDTRLIDAELKQIKDRYEFETPEAEPFDPKNTVEYKLAKYGRISDKSSLDEIQEAMDTIGEYDTPEAIKRYVELEDAYDKRVKYEEGDAYRKLQINNWKKTGGTGELSPWLSNHDYTRLVSGPVILLKNKAGKEVARIKNPNYKR